MFHVPFDAGDFGESENNPATLGESVSIPHEIVDVLTDGVKAFQRLVRREVTPAAPVFRLICKITGQSFGGVNRGIAMTENDATAVGQRSPVSRLPIKGKKRLPA